MYQIYTGNIICDPNVFCKIGNYIDTSLFRIIDLEVMFLANKIYVKRILSIIM